MGTREELLKQQAEWTIKYSEADKRVKALLPPVSNLSEGEELEEWIPTKESLASFEKAQRDVNRALVKLHQIRDKLYKLR